MLKSLFKRSAIYATSTVLLLASQASFAGDKYGAIAYSLEEGVYGYAVDYDSRDEAEDVALDECVKLLESDETECVVELWFKNAYGVLAEGDNGFGTGYGTYRQDAQLMALENCKKYTENCDISLTIGTE
ncbi:DUF4189 domain-containing protein [Candidatus Albibeggiatoa sp. nov. NOAA]|uniref:DUF4189 domain-containing protein n=1 Tax=Candidatus Albibeggiatoa sp. nov. NOAA TaxID=3162724 RepID=UPI0032FF9E64|nr:DUF4189 domain-containing protein [Thiotrichaceae bacterium]